MTSCHLCDAPTANAYRVCDDCRVALTEARCAEQGIPFKITAPADLAPLARLLRRDTKAAS